MNSKSFWISLVQLNLRIEGKDDVHDVHNLQEREFLKIELNILVDNLDDENSWNGENVENPRRALDPVFKVKEKKAEDSVEKEEKGAKTHINLVKMCGVPGFNNVVYLDFELLLARCWRGVAIFFGSS